MAKKECRLTGNFIEVFAAIDDAVRESVTGTLEDGSDFVLGSIRCAVRVYERYSMTGSNRVSMNITLVGTDGDLRLSAITSGGSQAMLFKVNTFGERAFLDSLNGVIVRFGA